MKRKLIRNGKRSKKTSIKTELQRFSVVMANENEWVGKLVPGEEKGSNDQKNQGHSGQD